MNQTSPPNSFPSLTLTLPSDIGFGNHCPNPTNQLQPFISLIIHLPGSAIVEIDGCTTRTHRFQPLYADIFQVYFQNCFKLNQKPFGAGGTGLGNIRRVWLRNPTHFHVSPFTFRKCFSSFLNWLVLFFF